MRSSALATCAVLCLVAASCSSEASDETAIEETPIAEAAVAELDPTVQSGMNPYTFTWDAGSDDEGSHERGYLLYVPDERLETPDEPWPLVLYLHGSGSLGDDLGALANGGALTGLVGGSDYRFVMAAPQASSADGAAYEDWAWFRSADYLKDFVDHVDSRVNVDRDRIYVTGYSLGAYGTWALATEYPDLPAALVTVAGAWNDTCNECPDPEDWTEQFPANVCDLKDIPIRVYHGDQDPIVPWESSQAMVDALVDCGSDVEFNLYEGVDHNISWVYDDPELFEWMLGHGTEEEWPVGGVVAPGEDCALIVGEGLAYETPGMDTVEVTCDLVYKAAPSGLDQTLDVFKPAGTQPGEALPAVIFFNNNGSDNGNRGRWPGDREHWIHSNEKYRAENHGRVLASLGMVGITFNLSSYPMRFDYGEPGEETMAFAVEDAEDLLSYVSEHAADLNVDPERLCVWTLGTGSMVGAYTALTGDPQISCAVVFAGTLDWDFAGRYNPAELVSADMPPFFIARAAQDIEGADGIDTFAFRVRQVEPDLVTVERIANAGFLFESFQPELPETEHVIAKALDFVMEHLGVAS